MAAALALAACMTGALAETSVPETAAADATDTSATDASATAEMDFSFSDRELSGEYDAAEATVITGAGSTVQITGGGAAYADGEGICITDAGVYVLRGEFTDMMVTVAAGGKDKVQLVLDGAQLANEGGPALYVRSADKVFITLAEGTQNAISDGAEYALSDSGSTLDAALFSKANLVINGTGTLRVDGRCKHGVVSKDDLVIVSCTLEVTARSAGLNGKDCVKLNGCTLRVEAGSDAIRSDNAQDASRGYVYMTGCTAELTAGNDGIQAETVLRAEDAVLSIVAGGSAQTLLSTEESCKGLKAGAEIAIAGGSYRIDSADDCVHADGTLTVTDGQLTLSSGDDGMHADTALTIAGGSIDILRSYEGVESSRILISGGRLRVFAQDDGLNAAGGSDGSAAQERFGRGHFSASTGEIEITGGYVVVEAMGDGIDANGSVSVSGGVTLVSGPEGGGDCAFDFDGSAAVTGGVLVAAGSSGMAQGFTSAENQGAVFCAFTPQQAGTPIALCGADGTAIVAFTPSRAYQSVVITAPGLEQGQSYSLVCGGTAAGADENGFAQQAALSGGETLESIELTSLLYNGGTGGGRGQKGFGGQAPGREPGGTRRQKTQPGE